MIREQCSCGAAIELPARQWMLKDILQGWRDGHVHDRGDADE